MLDKLQAGFVLSEHLSETTKASTRLLHMGRKEKQMWFNTLWRKLSRSLRNE